MSQEEIIEVLLSQYNSDIRKQLVESLLVAEKNEDTERTYTLMNQIFSYTLSQLGWSIANNAENWDPTPLKVISSVFPNIITTQWYKEQALHSKKNIDILRKDTE